MLIFQIVVGIILSCIIIIVIKGVREKRRKSKLNRIYEKGAELGESLSNAVDSYLSGRIKQFEEAFFPIYQERLLGIGEDPLRTPEEAATAEFELFAAELERILEQLPQEIQEQFSEPFKVAREVSMEIESTLIDFVSVAILKHYELIIEKAVAQATEAISKFQPPPDLDLK